MNPAEKKKSFFENHPKVCYALYAVLLFAFNLFLRWKDRELSADEYFISAINTLILTAGFVWGRPLSSQKFCESEENRRIPKK